MAKGSAPKLTITVKDGMMTVKNEGFKVQVDSYPIDGTVIEGEGNFGGKYRVSVIYLRDSW